MIEELNHLLQDPAHWAFEGITDVVFGGVAFAIGGLLPERLNPFKRWIARHDTEHHAGHTTEDHHNGAV